MYDNAQCTMHNLASGISSARTVDRSSARTRTSLADKARLVPTGRVQSPRGRPIPDIRCPTSDVRPPIFDPRSPAIISS